MGKMVFKMPLLAIVAALILGCDSKASGDEVAQVSENGNSITVEDFSMEWTVENNSITITVSAPTTGWIAVGFDPSAAMKDANIVIGYIQDGDLFISDDWGDGHISHSRDIDLGGTDDITGLSGSEENGITEITFSMPMESGDSYDTSLTQGSTHKIIIAYGPDEADDFQGYHAWAETIELEL